MVNTKQRALAGQLAAKKEAEKEEAQKTALR